MGGCVAGVLLFVLHAQRDYINSLFAPSGQPELLTCWEQLEAAAAAHLCPVWELQQGGCREGRCLSYKALHLQRLSRLLHHRAKVPPH